jgi:hypothetical protein
MTRNSKTKGYVNFPIDDPQYRDTGEGGMFVKLVVYDDKNLGACFGAHIIDVLNEVFVSDDCGGVESDHYPFIDAIESTSRYLSRPYLASLLLGSTNWSGWDDAKEAYWICRYEDLNPGGKELYCMMKELYPESEVRLVTFLDT